ncbi:MAG: pyridoxamine kinase [Dorea sp.]|nr:pyridoxamine kinase [Dorea sp.]
MAEKIAVINDLSGFGRCSLTAAISVISAMGVSPCPLPTAILSAQTGYPSYYCDDCTDKMEHFRREWEKMGAEFDGIYTGFVASEEQIRQIFRFLNTFHNKNNFLLVDPVMGDDGTPYDMFSDTLLSLMKELAFQADIITPNVTELCLLTGADYGRLAATLHSGSLLKEIRTLALSLCSRKLKHVIVTGIRFSDERGIRQMGNLYAAKESCQMFSFPYVGGSYSGTGDLFASCLCAGIARGDDIPSIIQTAGEFIELSLADSVKEGVGQNDGVNYEKYLSLLIPKSARVSSG